jgi:putative spermidine/putrescine transport system permease protein
LATRAASAPLSPPRSAAAGASRGLPTGPLLVAPAAVFLLVFFVVPAVQMIAYSVSGTVESGVYRPGLTLANYERLVAVDLYWLVLVRTVRVAALASVVAVFLAYPLALAIARGSTAVVRLVTVVVIAPLLVNVVIRSYGWQAILNRRGALAWLLETLGLHDGQVRILYTEWAVLIASVHVFLPFMVLPLASAIGRIDPAVEHAAAVAGASPWRVFTRVTLPLSLPGLTVGVSLVFSLTAAAYVTPQILGGNFAPLLGTLIEQQVLTLHDWPFGAAISTALIAMVLAVNLLFIRVLSRRFARWTAGAA